MRFDVAAIERRLAALESNRGASLRFGTVTDVNPTTGTARVQLPDGNGMVSHPLRTLQKRSLKDQHQTLPDVGEPVAVLFSGQGFEQGVVLGAAYSQKTPAPGQTATHDYTRYEDGTELWYDRAAHKLIAKVQGDVELETKGSVSVKAQGSISLESPEGITLKAPSIGLKGNLIQTDTDGGPASSNLCGTFRVRQGDVIAESVSLVGHTHEGVETGPDTTGIPVGGA